MNTEKLYYTDCHLAEFTGRVVSCAASEKGWLVVLDRTAFYPEGGGQAADTGVLGDARVTYVYEDGEQVVHVCDGPLTLGETVSGRIDWPERFDRMQQHTGEHMVSGLIHARYGHHNTGFHMGATSVTIDFDGIIPAEDLPVLERLANEGVWADIPLKIWTPEPEELPNVFYRTKRALPWPVRIVQVPGYDSCACCGVHAARTGEVGLVKLLSVVRFRTGSRIEMLCGRRALDYLNVSLRENLLVSRAFSAKLDQTGVAAEQMNALLGAQKAKIAQLETQAFEAIAASCAGRGDVLIFREGLDSVLVRKLADLAADTCGGTAAVFSGSDEEGYSYCLVRRNGDLRQFGKEMNLALSGRGGGKPEFQQGSVKAGRQAVLEHFVSFLLILE
ncbi:MAG: alanyl-tRNA editing protein [Oscillospiraceae bacterium]|nr:alanyl-tRNA editing protein [Oscillospiraceae bacterium]